jgi:hypothetical protein
MADAADVERQLELARLDWLPAEAYEDRSDERDGD